MVYFLTFQFNIMTHEQQNLLWEIFDQVMLSKAGDAWGATLISLYYDGKLFTSICHFDETEREPVVGLQHTLEEVIEGFKGDPCQERYAEVLRQVPAGYTWANIDLFINKQNIVI